MNTSWCTEEPRNASLASWPSHGVYSSSLKMMAAKLIIVGMPTCERRAPLLGHGGRGNATSAVLFDLTKAGFYR